VSCNTNHISTFADKGASPQVRMWASRPIGMKMAALGSNVCLRRMNLPRTLAVGQFRGEQEFPVGGEKL
jgi:hypothetical protein